jgi:uncharacterized protein YbjT (DUF2867 family)
MVNVLVAGATGTQGGSVVESLASGEFGAYELYGLTRDATSERARTLAERGVTVVEGDMTDAERMRELCTGMDVVFCVTTFFEDGTVAETEQGVTLAEAAADAGVTHFVFSSVAGADRDTGLEHFESKYAVERAIAGLDLPTTVVRPVYFMQNVAFMLGEEVAAGRLPMPLDPDVTLALVDANDIGRVVATAIADPERFAGETIEIAGDDLTLAEMAEALTAATGHEVEPVYVDLEEYRGQAGDELADMYAWFNEVGYDIDREALAADYGIECRSFEAFLAESEAFRPAPTA